MLHAALSALERRCRSEAPSLLADVQALRALTAPAAASASTLIDDPVDLSSMADTWIEDAATIEVPARATRFPEARFPETRYDDLGPIGKGGMGDVRRVRDRELNRVLAMKVVKPGLLQRPTSLARFVEEAQVAAQLQHPSIVPVHELGRLADGRIYFTMKEVSGRTLSEVIAQVHAGWGAPTSTGWSFRRLVAALHQASQAVAYAHERGVVHRDLKPDNIMVGDYGEVLVMDWGLAKVLGRPDFAADDGALDPVVTDRSQDDAARSQMGRVAGTPAYMAPEQARGQVDRIDARTDVYALGAILYQVLSGRAPYTGRDGRAVWQQVLQGPPPRPTRGEGGAPSELELVEACEQAMARDPDHRHPSAEAFAVALQSWLDGSKRREQALAVVERAEAALPEAQALRERATALRVEADALLEGVPGWAPEEDKAPGWAKHDEADELERQAILQELVHEQLLEAAFTHAPQLPEAHAALAELHRQRHAAAEATRDEDAMAKAETLLRHHADALREGHEVRTRCATYLVGDGALSLVTDPPGAEVFLHRYEERSRRLVQVPVRSLGTTPLRELSLPMGSYLCLLRHPERAEVRYPVHVGRGAHWDGVRPGSSGPTPIHLPRPETLGPDDCYVPAGWFLAGDGVAYGSVPVGTRLWCDAAVVRRFPVTNRAYLRFLDDLVARGREADALRWAPRERAGQQGELGALVYGRDDGGRFHLVADAEGDVWLPDWPVMMVDWHCAAAYAAWYAGRAGQPWRLPWDLEWEKAARGVDGRPFPWGDSVDPSYCCYRDSHPGRPLPVLVDSFPVDVSAYGIRGLGGNVEDWCVDTWTPDGALPAHRIVRPVEEHGGPPDRARRVRRGGHWLGAAGDVRSAFRYGVGAGGRVAALGFRLARSLVPAV